ncbi:hypothetical protein J8J40_32600, partial [Mycobacterium tuberculosis]|nr:hypothetical protein [Mycobacterium tuberculosis]MBP0651811.1 hypothetical protein [Mycobacterium tuberculosis]
MAFGGPLPTPTDAMIHLGRTAAGDRARAAAAMAGLAGGLGMTADGAAAAILDATATRIADSVRALVAEVDAKPVYT